MSFLYISSKMFFTPCLRLITELWASRKLNNEASLCWASWGENDFYLQKKKVIFVQKALRSVSAVENRALGVLLIAQFCQRCPPVQRSFMHEISIIFIQKKIFTPSHSPTILSVPRTRYQTKTHLRIFSISRIVPGLLPVFSWLKTDISIARVAKLCDVVSIFQLAYHWTRS